MTGIHFAIAVLVKLILAAMLVGVVRRGYHRRCLTFIAYALAALVLDSLITFWPSLFWNWPFWNFSQSVYAVLKLGVAVELAVRSLGAFPGTWGMARFFNGVVLLLTTAAWIFSAAPDGALASISHRVLSTGTIWLFAATALIGLWFHLPLHPWHRALLAGFTPYLFVFTTLANIASKHATEWVPIIGAVDQLAYLSLTAWWAYAAWRPVERYEGVSPVVLRRLRLDEA